MKQEIKLKYFFKQSPQEVWDYLTKPQLLGEWLMDNDFKPIVGHKFQFKDQTTTDCENQGIAYCEVLKIIPYQLLSYSWRSGKSEGKITIDSVVVWTLTGKNGGTELRLQHRGFKLLEELHSHTNGWKTIINQLTQLLNTTNDASTKA